MDQQIDEYINNFIDDCLGSEHFVNKSDDEKGQLRERLATHLQGVVLHTLVDNLNMDQLERFNNIDPNSDDAPVEVEKLASEVPDFITMVDEVLKKEVESIKESGNVPGMSTKQEHNSW